MQTLRTTLNLNADLIDLATQRHPGMTRTAIIEEALKALLARDAALRLAAMGGMAPRAKAARRRRSVKR